MQTGHRTQAVVLSGWQVIPTSPQYISALLFFFFLIISRDYLYNHEKSPIEPFSL